MPPVPSSSYPADNELKPPPQPASALPRLVSARKTGPGLIDTPSSQSVQMRPHTRLHHLPPTRHRPDPGGGWRSRVAIDCATKTKKKKKPTLRPRPNKAPVSAMLVGGFSPERSASPCGGRGLGWGQSVRRENTQSLHGMMLCISPRLIAAINATPACRKPPLPPSISLRSAALGPFPHRVNRERKSAADVFFFLHGFAREEKKSDRSGRLPHGLRQAPVKTRTPAKAMRQDGGPTTHGRPCPSSHFRLAPWLSGWQRARREVLGGLGGAISSPGHTATATGALRLTSQQRTRSEHRAIPRDDKSLGWEGGRRREGWPEKMYVRPEIRCL